MTQQTQRTRKLPQFGTGEYWQYSVEAQEMINVCTRLEAVLLAVDDLEYRYRNHRYTDREPLMRWVQLMAGHIYELEREARTQAFAVLDAEAAEKAAQERAPEGEDEDADEDGEE